MTNNSSGIPQITPRTRTISGSKVAATATHYRGETILSIPKARKLNPYLVSLLKPNSQDAGSYHRLRHTVESMSNGTDGVVISITSPNVGDGKTLTAMNLAGALAHNVGTRVLLIDLDLRQKASGINDYLGISKSPAPGVVDWLGNSQPDWESVVHFIPEFNLYLMLTGRSTDSPYELLTSKRFTLLLTEARQRYDYVILDTAPILPVPDSQLISALVDGFIVIVAADHTRKKMLEEALNMMKPEKVLGLVYNSCSSLDADTQPY